MGSGSAINLTAGSLPGYPENQHTHAREPRVWWLSFPKAGPHRYTSEGDDSLVLHFMPAFWCYVSFLFCGTLATGCLYTLFWNSSCRVGGRPRGMIASICFLISFLEESQKRRQVLYTQFLHVLTVLTFFTLLWSSIHDQRGCLDSTCKLGFCQLCHTKSCFVVYRTPELSLCPQFQNY